MDNQNKLKLYRELFRWRNDIYAYRREKWEKSWYSPAYDFNRYKFNMHKSHWWTISTFEDKTPKPLTDEVIISHLKWEKIIFSIYRVLPICQTNISL